MTDHLAGRHRAALIEAGREAGAFLADDVSDDFLLYVPGEVKGRIAKLGARIKALEAALAPFASLDVLEPNGVVIGLERWHFERARAALAPGAPSHAD